jgi:hypothetical protein
MQKNKYVKSENVKSTVIEPDNPLQASFNLFHMLHRPNLKLCTPIECSTVGKLFILIPKSSEIPQVLLSTILAKELIFIVRKRNPKDVK